MQCENYFQPIVNYLKLPVGPAGEPAGPVTFLVAGNRAEENRFVVYMEGVLTQLTTTLQKTGATLTPGGPPIELEVQQIVGNCRAYFSDRLGPGNQPFNVNQVNVLDVFLTLPNGPLTFQSGGTVVSRFSALECRENGLLVCTSDLDRSIFVLSINVPIIR